MIICNIGMINRSGIFEKIFRVQKMVVQKTAGPKIRESVYYELLKKASLEKSHLLDRENER